MKIKTNSTFGNFAFSAVAEITEEQMSGLAAAGLLQVLQRSPASKAEKAMAGYEKRPSGFSRDSIPFSEASAEVLASELAKAEFPDGTRLDLEVEVREHVPGEGAEPKYSEEKAMIARKGGDAARLLALAEAVSYDGEDLTADNVEFLKAIRNHLKAYRAAL